HQRASGFPPGLGLAAAAGASSLPVAGLSASRGILIVVTLGLLFTGATRRRLSSGGSRRLAAGLAGVLGRFPAGGLAGGIRLGEMLADQFSDVVLEGAHVVFHVGTQLLEEVHQVLALQPQIARQLVHSDFGHTITPTFLYSPRRRASRTARANPWSSTATTARSGWPMACPSSRMLATSTHGTRLASAIRRTRSAVLADASMEMTISLALPPSTARRTASKPEASLPARCARPRSDNPFIGRAPAAAPSAPRAGPGRWAAPAPFRGACPSRLRRNTRRT